MIDHEIVYWEVWEDDKTLQVHYGVVGETGETEEVKLRIFEKAEKVMKKLAEEKLNEGYEHLDEEELIELVVQYPYEESQMKEALDGRHNVEDLMNECLGWTGNGFCDGGDIGSGTTNVVNYVIDAKKALKTITIELSNNNLLEKAKIAYLGKDEEYVCLYPEGADFDLLLYS